jgi:hypothetical protein
MRSYDQAACGSKMALKFDCSLRRREDEVVLRVSPRTLDRALAATNPEFYRPDDWRIQRLLELPEGTRVAIPKIGACDGCFGFEDGRHRMWAAKQQGLKVIPVAVRKTNVAELQQLLSRFRSR